MFYGTPFCFLTICRLLCAFNKLVSQQHIMGFLPIKKKTIIFFDYNYNYLTIKTTLQL
jgi:hypothetical protein